MAELRDLGVTLKPTRGRCLIEVAPPPDRSAGGVLYPDWYIAQQYDKRGRVLDLGEPEMNHKGKVRPWEVEVGDEVLFQTYGGSVVYVDDKGFLMLTPEELLAKFEKEGGKN